MIPARTIPLGPASDTTVMRRAQELAVIKGRNPLDTCESDIGMARRELMVRTTERRRVPPQAK